MGSFLFIDDQWVKLLYGECLLNHEIEFMSSKSTFFSCIDRVFLVIVGSSCVWRAFATSCRIESC